MSHSVRRHLHLDVEEYDRSIRRFIPAYEEMLSVLCEHALAGAPGRILDLGAGTGAVAEVLLSASDEVAVELLDADPEMLGVAGDRLARFESRASFRTGSFTDPLPDADVVTASLSLHHLPTLAEKESVYRGIHAALPENGLVVNADVTLPGGEADRAQAFRRWAAHLVSEGIPEERAWQHFAEWADEDTYFPVEDELAAMARAGFEARRVWHHSVVSVLVGRKTPGPYSESEGIGSRPRSGS